MKKNILLIGCGNLGQILLTRWIKKKINISVVEKNKNILDFLKKKFKKPIFFSSLNDIKFKKIDYIVLCVKPDVSIKLIKAIKENIFPKHIIVSTVAGLRVKNIISYCLKDNLVLRVMPNIFADVESSATGIFCRNKVTESKKKEIEGIFKSFGILYWIKKEEHMNLFTALYGGGPAYFFYFLKTLTEISTSNGIKHSDSQKLILSLLKGTNNFLNKNKNNSMEKLISKVTSKGGTTVEAINYLEKDKVFFKIFKTAILKAKKKSEYLSNF